MVEADHVDEDRSQDSDEEESVGESSEEVELIAGDKKFEPDPYMMVQLLNTVDVNKHLHEEQASIELENNFVCMICMLVVENPRVCTSCKASWCHFCISRWLGGHKACPNCRGVIDKNQEMEAEKLNKLNEVLFQCDRCDLSFKYADRKEHWQTCGLQIRCQLEECPQKFTSYNTLAELKGHWQRECPIILLNCSECKLKLQRAQITSHKCKKSLSSKLRRMGNALLAQLIERVRIQIGQAQAQELAMVAEQMVPHEPQKLEVQKPAQSDYQTVKKCDNGHELTYIEQAVDRHAHGMQMGGEHLLCDGCDQPICLFLGYFHCDFDCDFDICLQCGTQ